MNVADLLTRQAWATPHATAVIHGDRSFSYAELDSLVWGLCRHLRDCGLRAGDVVGLHLDDPTVHLAGLLATARSGLVSVAIGADGADTAAGNALLRRTGASAVIDGPRELPWSVATRIPLDVDVLASLTADPDPALRDDQPQRLLHFKTSSGTTGAPKIVGATHAGMIASIEREIASIGYLPGERYLTPVSIRLDGPRRRYLACLAAGSVAVMPTGKGSVAAMIDTIDQHDVRHFSCVPSQAYELARAVAPGRQRFPSMRCFRLSAGPSEASLHRLVRERLTSNVLISYGCTELGSMTAAPPELVAAQPQTVGRPMPGIEVQIVGDDGCALPPGEVGLVRIRAEGMPGAYHDDPKATARFFRDGWFYPGDVGRLDAQGLLFHLGRADGMMVADGINIYPAEIEQAMLSHPQVRDAVAMPLKHPVTHDVPVCALVLADGASLGESDLMLFARITLGAHRPRRIAILERIPRNEHGKVQRPALSQLVAQRLGLARPGQPSAAPPAAAPIASPTGVLGQLAIAVSVRFRLPPQPAFGPLDAWLDGLLGLEIQTDDVPSHPPEAQAGAWVRRMVLLARMLMQAARIPVFDAPRVLSCQPVVDDGPAFQARVAFALVDELPAAAYDLALQGAFHLGAWAMAHPVDDGNVQAFYTLAKDRTLTRLHAMWRHGKSTMPVLRIAYQRSVPFTHLGEGVVQLGWGHQSRRLDRSVTGHDSAIGARLCADKATTAALLRRAGFPAPDHEVVTTLDEAIAAARRIGWPVVVKPADRERGEGVVVDVVSDDELQSAFVPARALSRRRVVIVERQVDGVCHRLFMAHGKLLYAVKRLPMSVTGDGESTVVELVDAEVARQRRLPPWERSGIEPIDALALAAIERAGLTPSAVPAAGRLVPLRRIESTTWGGVDEEVTGRVHLENLRLATAATELFGLTVAGIDIITTDISRPWFETGAIVNEVNFAPLLGGADISRSHIPTFLDRFVDGTGTIPVEVFVGGEAAWAAATARWHKLLSSGLDAFLTRADRTLMPSTEEWHMPGTGLHRRTRALVLCPHAKALVLVVQTDEWLSTGLPLEAISSLTIVDEQLALASAGSAPAPPDRVAALLRQLHAWPRFACATAV